MTLGEKLTHLRISADLSQEQFAEKFDVSRQAVSKWETDQAKPMIDTILQVCDYFDLSADDLLRDDIVIHRQIEKKTPGENTKHRYFGTDGFRGEANVDLTAEHAYRIGRFLGWFYQSPLSGKRKVNYRPKIVIGKDTRRSGYMLEYALVAGITSSGADAYMLHVTTTPSVSYVTRVDEFDCGIMITASHNPFYDNGIKIINSYGEKFDDSDISYIEAYLDGYLDQIGIEGDDLPLAKRDRVGKIIDYVAGRNRYVGYLISVASHSYRGLKIGLDCANGASWSIAKAVFEALGAQIVLIGASPDGTNVNSNCGSTHIETLAENVKEQHLDVGFAFDGDADRCIAVDDRGNVVDGDKIIYVLAMRLKSRGLLDSDTVVTTIMSNSGLDSALGKVGISNVRTNVGDRYVYEKMQECGYRLGGEQSGHIILRKYATTGDGILTAIMLSEEICDSKTTLSSLCAPVCLLPQVTKSVRVTSKDATMNDETVKTEFDEINSEIKGNGRAVLRASGTEPVIRIMMECESTELCEKYIARLVSVIKKRGLYCE